MRCRLKTGRATLLFIVSRLSQHYDEPITGLFFTKQEIAVETGGFDV